MEQTQAPPSSLSNPSPIESLPYELLRIIISMSGDLHQSNTNANAKTLSLVSRQMRPPAQRHLFWNKTITFHGNGGASAGGKGFNDWCETQTMAGVDSKSRDSSGTVIDPVPSLFGSIHYHERAEWFDSLEYDSKEYVPDFNRVTTLKLSFADLINLPHIPDFKLLGGQIKTLTFDHCVMGVNELVSYLLPFDNLEHLTISTTEFIQVDPEVEKQTFEGPLPSFNGTLSLSHDAAEGEREGEGEVLIKTLGKIPNMNYSRITIRKRMEWVLPSGLLNTFFSKFRNTLTHLWIDSTWGNFSVSELTTLKNLVIDVTLDYGSLLPIIDGLRFPSTTTEFVLSVANCWFDVEAWWTELDKTLMSLKLPHRNKESKLHFYLAGNVGEGRLPRFKARKEILVDESLIGCLRL